MVFYYKSIFTHSQTFIQGDTDHLAGCHLLISGGKHSHMSSQFEKFNIPKSLGSVEEGLQNLVTGLSRRTHTRKSVCGTQNVDY